MPFWPVVLCALLGVPFVLFVTGMGMIFAAAGYAGGPQESRAKVVVYGWLMIAWVLAAVFGAFGLVPAWRAWHAGGEDFAGGLQTFVDWLIGVGIAGALGAVVLRVMALSGRAGEGGAPAPSAVLGRWVVLSIVAAPWAAIIAWIAWPLVLWPVQGRFEWPDAAVGWAHTGELTAALLAVFLVEDAVRRRRKG